MAGHVFVAQQHAGGFGPAVTVATSGGVPEHVTATATTANAIIAWSQLTANKPDLQLGPIVYDVRGANGRFGTPRTLGIGNENLVLTAAGSRALAVWVTVVGTPGTSARFGAQAALLHD
jgi:hypothetical protein